MKRIYHTWDKWECYPAGFYENRPADKSLSDDDCRGIYADFLRDIDEFESAMTRVISEWPHSCEHYLSNENMNRIAWLGQAAVCVAKGIPAQFRGGYNWLSDEEKLAADTAALKFLNEWLTSRGEPVLSMSDAASKTQVDLY